jgi:hypothetical protein
MGSRGDTPLFADEASACLWEDAGRAPHPHADWMRSQPAADCVSGRSRCAIGCSKWSPIEHRLFGPICLNWAGTPRPWQMMLEMLEEIRGTATAITVWSVVACLQERLLGRPAGLGCRHADAPA